MGLVTLSTDLADIQRELHTLRDSGLPRLVKVSQLSQEASASISIAPALSANPTRFEFETLLSRIKDKDTSQATIIDELTDLVRDDEVAQTLRLSGKLLTDNLRSLTDVVSQQIALRKVIESHVELLLRVERRLETSMKLDGESGNTATTRSLAVLATRAIQRLLTMILDPNSARFPRNRNDAERELINFLQVTGYDSENQPPRPPVTDLQLLAIFWIDTHVSIFENKQQTLSNEFKIRALVEENSRIANRLLTSAGNEFWRASSDLQNQVQLVEETTRITLLLILGIVAAFAIGILVTWLVLGRRVFTRLDRIRDALRSFADHREHPEPDKYNDEIGSIFASLIHYMDVINERENQLADKTVTLEQLSSQLAKYLAPQVYDSIFSGKQQVRVASTRKKLTVFFSDIAGFTETADRLESEELSFLLNHYLTEMSNIALEYGATIDKYIGDAILLFFGDPETRGVKNDAIACVDMAIEMRARMLELSDIWHAKGIAKPLRIRMGINTGYCTVGNFGSEDRMDYTIVGGTVNMASRLESLVEPGEILISYETFALVRDKIHCEEFGEVDIKGIAYPVATYRVIDAYTNLHERRQMQEIHNHIKVNIDLDKMTAEDRDRAQEVLKRALDFIVNGISGGRK
ncbi:MAG: hypothetical protein DHS20C01_01410 [marine bacterium B5-7]|nr:MAG: hypothetical protein DHS20C01_01410 [marine bacterium B5-7]